MLWLDYNAVIASRTSSQSLFTRLFCRAFSGVSAGFTSSEVWSFDLTLQQWALRKGDPLNNVAAVFGVRGVPAPDNTPGPR